METQEQIQYQESKPIIMSNKDRSITVLCANRHVITNIRRGEWAGSIWEARLGDPKYTVKCSACGRK